MPPIKNVTPKEAAELMKGPTPARYIDVRSSGEYAAGHAPGSINVPLNEGDGKGAMVPNPLFTKAMVALFPPATPLVVACAAGGRSRQAATTLEAAGYTSIANMMGGFSGGRGPAGPVAGWAATGLPVVTDGTSWEQVRVQMKPVRGS